MNGNDKHERIRQRAHTIWEREGRPDGADQRHWHEASAEIDTEESAVPAPAKGRKAAKAAPRSPAKSPVKPPSAEARNKSGAAPGIARRSKDAVLAPTAAPAVPKKRASKPKGASLN